MKFFTYYLPLCVLAGYAAILVLGTYGFWAVYVGLAYLAMTICVTETLQTIDQALYDSEDY